MNASKALNSLCCRCIFLFIDSLLYSSQYLQYCLSVYIDNRVSISSSNLDMSSVSLCAFIAWHFESIRISYSSWEWKVRRTELRISRSSPKEATNSWYKCSETTCEVLDWRIGFFLENRLTISQTDNSYVTNIKSGIKWDVIRRRKARREEENSCNKWKSEIQSHHLIVPPLVR